MRIIIFVVLLTGCAHVAATRATFSRQADGPVVLRLTRHLDTIVRGPDSEEDQFLELELKRLTLGQRLVIPSDDVAVHFSAQRFGPKSQGQSYQGYVILRSISPEQIVAVLKLEVAAQTAGGAANRGDHDHR